MSFHINSGGDCAFDVIGGEIKKLLYSTDSNHGLTLAPHPIAADLKRHDSRALLDGREVRRQHPLRRGNSTTSIDQLSRGRAIERDLFSISNILKYQ